MQLTASQLDRAIGTITASAFGDVLGQGYEFGPPISPSVALHFADGPFYPAGEWTDDTSQALAIALAGISHPLHSEEGLNSVAANFLSWSIDANDIGNQTRSVFNRTVEKTAAAMLAASESVLVQNPNAAGNGSLMRTGPIALQYLSDAEGFETAIRSISALTHAEQSCIEACLIWSKAIRHAILHGNPDGVWLAINDFPEGERRNFWTSVTLEAEQNSPAEFPKNGWVIKAYQVAWSAISHTDPNDPNALLSAIEACIRVGDDTDTTAAICGSLAGATWGHSALPAQFEEMHGWPELRGSDLPALALKLAK